MNSIRGSKSFFAKGIAGDELDTVYQTYKNHGAFGSVIFIYFVEFIYSATVFAGSAESIQ